MPLLQAVTDSNKVCWLVALSNHAAHSNQF